MSRPTSRRGNKENIPPNNPLPPQAPRPPLGPARSSSSSSRNLSKKKKGSKPRRSKRHDFFSRPQIAPMVLTGKRIKPLQTFSELTATENLVDAFVVEIPVTLANNVVSLFKQLLIASGTIGSLHHLRRLVNFPNLPESFRQQYGLLDFDPDTIFFVLPKAEPISIETINLTLKPEVPPSLSQTKGLPRVFQAQVPGFPPKTIEKAKWWSDQHWPCIFNPASHVLQEAPPHAQLRTVLAELDTEKCEQYLLLANSVATEMIVRKCGRQVGAVIVDPQTHQVLAVAGDARWWSVTPAVDKDATHSSGNEGRPEQHALMRAIAMVAAKEVRRRNSEGLRLATERDQNRDLEGQPLTSTESLYSSAPDNCMAGVVTIENWPKPQSEHRKDSYLCSGLDVYLTHEPCICCSMAMVHSRFRACVFRTKLPGTGGISAETDDGGLGYGLFWRKELNWRLMAFQYTGDLVRGSADDATTQVFHA